MSLPSGPFLVAVQVPSETAVAPVILEWSQTIDVTVPAELISALNPARIASCPVAVQNGIEYIPTLASYIFARASASRLLLAVRHTSALFMQSALVSTV